jgi:putative flippase GtrA
MVLKNKHTLLLQLTRFGLVGILAAAVHFSMVVLLVEAKYLGPLLANGVAFCVAFQVSYWGHRLWTFSNTQRDHATAFSRLLLVSMLAFIANEALFYLLMKQGGLPYPLALLLVLSMLPGLVFSVNKWWVFA